MVPVTRQLNIPNAHLRLTQIASALRWDIVKVHSDYELNSLPSDLIAENLYGRLVRHVDDLPSDSDLVLVLIDTTFHRQPPSWQPQIVRKAMYSLPRLTAAQFLRAMYLSRYCDANELPCLVYRNERIWRQDPDIAVDLANGDYFRLEIPPMHNDRTGLDTRCLAVAMHQNIDISMLDFVGGLTEEQLHAVPNPYQIMLEQNTTDSPTFMNLIQVKIVVQRASLQASSQSVIDVQLWRTTHILAGHNSPWSQTPRIQATLGYHNAWDFTPCSPEVMSSQVQQSTQVCVLVILPHAMESYQLKRCASNDNVLPSKMPQTMQVSLQHKVEAQSMKVRPTQKKTWWYFMHRVANCQHVPVFSQRCRMGEASVPGPQDPDQPDQSSVWAIGAINPTGVAGKAVLFADLPAGIYALSETHLTDRGRARFIQEIKYAKLQMRLTTGYDAPYKKDGLKAIGGKHTGVGFLSSYPVRPILNGWDNELYCTSRLHAATFQVHQTCIAGGVCYGYAHAADTRQTQERTDKLLSQLTHQIVFGFPGPAFIAGDFNQVPGILHEPQVWESRGWRDIQTCANEHFGIVPGPTCCHTSRKDFVYLSPSLQQLMKSCSNSFDKFPDHATLLGLLELPSKPQPIARWPQPHQIDYHDVAPHVIADAECKPADSHADPTTQYMAICQQFEQHVDCVRAQHGVVRLTQKQQGRGQTLHRTFILPKVAAIKPARPGDVQPTINSWSLHHCRWITQCRRLDNFVKQVRKNSIAPTALEQRAALWRSIRLAPGFVGGFSSWWQQQAVSNPNMLPWVPQEPPTLAIAEHIQSVFTQALHHMEKQIISTRVAMARSNRASDVNRVFRDVRKPPPVPVHMLVAKASAVVLEVVDEGSVIVDSSQAIQNATVLETRTGPMHVIHIEEQQIWFTSPHTLVVGDVVAEVNMKGQIHEIHQAFVDEWTQRWDRHRNLAPHHWKDILDLTETLLQCPPMELKPITLQRWKSTIKAKKPSSATGLDGVSRRDLLAFPDQLHLQIIAILEQAESTGQWPEQLLCGSVHSLEKVPNAQSVSQYRPITIIPLVY